MCVTVCVTDDHRLIGTVVKILFIKYCSVVTCCTVRGCMCLSITVASAETIAHDVCKVFTQALYYCICISLCVRVHACVCGWVCMSVCVVSKSTVIEIFMVVI